MEVTWRKLVITFSTLSSERWLQSQHEGGKRVVKPDLPVMALSCLSEGAGVGTGQIGRSRLSFSLG